MPLTITNTGTTQTFPMSRTVAAHQVPEPVIAGLVTMAAKTWMAITPRMAATRSTSRATERVPGLVFTRKRTR